MATKKPAAPVAQQITTTLEVGGGWCRANQHNWKPRPPFKVEKQVIFVKFKCEHCTGERHDDISLRTGDLINRAYIMPTGYYLHTGDGQARPTKADWRKAHYAQLVGKKGRK